jgi:hypothetical protein
MKKQINDIIDYHLNRVQHLYDIGNKKEAQNLYNEIREWILRKNSIEIVSLEYLNEILTDF